MRGRVRHRDAPRANENLRSRRAHRPSSPSVGRGGIDRAMLHAASNLQTYRDVPNSRPLAIILNIMNPVYVIIHFGTTTGFRSRAEVNYSMTRAEVYSI